MRWINLSACVLLVAAVGCGGGGSSDGDASRKLSADEQEYADEIAVVAGEEVVAPADAPCVGEGLVRAFGLKRAKELSLAEKNSADLSRSDAEKVIVVLDGCASLAELIVKEAQTSLGLSDAEVLRCAELLDRAKIRELMVRAQIDESTEAETKELQSDLLAALPRCKG